MAKKKGTNTAEAVWLLAQPVVTAMGLQLWDVRFVKEGAQWYLRIFIDKEGGVCIEDCEAVSRALDQPLDEADLIEQSYCLEVCSPGLERELIREEHFEKFIGADVLVHMIRPIEPLGKEFGGILKAADKHTFTVSDGGENEITIHKKDAAWVKLDDFAM